MVGLWAYAAGIGATNKYNQIKDEQRALAGQKELDKLEAKLNPTDNTNDLNPNLFSLAGTDVSFGLPSRDEMLRLPDVAARRSAHSNTFLNGILGYSKEDWEAIKNSSDANVVSEYNRMEREFTDSLQNYWKFEGTTDDQSPIYKKFNYDGLKDVIPDLYEKISKIDPLHDPEQEYNPDLETDWNIKEGVKFGADSSMEDIVHIPYKFSKNGEQNKKEFNNYYGIDFGKDTVMSGKYGSWSQQQYENAKANSPWGILIPTYMGMMDDNKVSLEEGRKSIVELQLAHGLSDEALIKAMSTGTAKYELVDWGGGKWVRRKIGKVSKPQVTRAHDARANSLKIVEQIDMLQGWIQESEDSALGLAGWIRKFFKGTILDDNSQIQQLQNFISTARGSSDIIWAGNTFEEQQANRDGVVATLEQGLKDMQDLYSSHNNEQIDLWDVTKGEDVFRGKTVTQSMIDTLSIGLAFSIALTEQGSGGKAVSDQDFKNAISRIKGEWFTSKSEALGSLNVEKHKFAERYIKEGVLTGEYASHGNALLQNYENIITARNEYLTDLKKDFLTVGAQELGGRTQRLLDMYTTVGGSQDGVLFPGKGEVIAKSKEQQFGKRPDVLRDEGFQTLFSQLTDRERKSAMVRLGSRENLDELQDSLKKKNGKSTIIESFQDYEKISKGYTVPNPIKGGNAVDFTQRILNENPDILVKDAIDLAIARYQQDKRPMFREDINEAIEKEEEVRTFILKQWMIKYYKQDSDIFRRAMGEIGTVTNPENQNTLNSIYSDMWGQN